MMGLYMGQLLASTIPCVLPKLCLSLSLSTLRDNPFKEIVVTGSYSGAEVFKMELGPDQIDAIMAQSPPRAEKPRYMMIQLMAVMSPFQMEKAGKLNLHVVADGQDLPCEGLEMIEAPPGFPLA
ncbi:hypothetical protein D3C77_412660 [compost metagenome]